MKKLVVSLGLIACSSVRAEWVLLNNDSQVANYYESSIRKFGSSVKVYELFDYKAPAQPHNAKSVGYLVKYDCNLDTLQVLTTIYCSEHMGAGTVLNNDPTPGPLNQIAPGTLVPKKWILFARWLANELDALTCALVSTRFLNSIMPVQLNK